jgi:hypothetical protein
VSQSAGDHARAKNDPPLFLLSETESVKNELGSANMAQGGVCLSMQSHVSGLPLNQCQRYLMGIRHRNSFVKSRRKKRKGKKLGIQFIALNTKMNSCPDGFSPKVHAK